MTKAEFTLLLQFATKDLDFTIQPFYMERNREPYSNVSCSQYRLHVVYLEINLKTIQRNHIEEIVELAKEKRKETVYKATEQNRPMLGEVFTLDRYSMLFYDADGNLIPISQEERGFLASLATGDSSAWRPYIDFLSESGMELQSRLILHYLQQHERIIGNAQYKQAT